MLPLLTGYFVWKRKLGIGTVRRLIVAFAGRIVFANFYPFPSNSAG